LNLSSVNSKGSFAVVLKGTRKSTRTTVAFKVPLNDAGGQEIQHENDMMLELKDAVYSVDLLESIKYDNRFILVHTQNMVMFCHTKSKWIRCQIQQDLIILPR
jgi:hypothetical protein